MIERAMRIRVRLLQSLDDLGCAFFLVEYHE
jgi:hypothetical protein